MNTHLRHLSNFVVHVFLEFVYSHIIKNNTSQELFVEDNDRHKHKDLTNNDQDQDIFLLKESLKIRRTNNTWVCLPETLSLVMK